jgi:hypothetical protein
VADLRSGGGGRYAAVHVARTRRKRAVLALAAGEPAVLGHLASRLSAADRSRSRARLICDGLLALVPRLGRCAVVRRFSGTSDTFAALVSDRNLVLAGMSAAATHGLAAA